jgi:hypothetical protein
MNLAQLLGCQGRADIPVSLANHRQHRSPQRCGLRRLLRRPRRLEIRPTGPSVRYACNSRNTCRRSSRSN